jgi:osmoprotectant transport system ATP-binding protein
MIRLSGVGKTYDDGTVAVQELDLDVAAASWSCWSARRAAASPRR